MKTIQLQVAVSLDENGSKILVELLGQALKQASLPQNGDVDERREARLRASRNAIFAGQKTPEEAGLLVDTRQAAKLLKVSARTIWAMQKDGRMPPAVHIGSAVRWSYDALKQWVEAGCPKREPQS